MGNSQLYYLMMVLYSTGIRISELPYVTVEAVCRGKTEIYMKGKCRLIIFPRNLIKQLVKIPNNVVRVMVEGQERVELLGLDSEDPMLVGEIGTLTESEDSLDYVTRQAMVRILKEKLEEYGKENP